MSGKNMRTMFFSVITCCSMCVACGAADPTKDPEGWAQVKFGMSPDQVLQAIGSEGYVETPPPVFKKRPFGIDGTVDVPAAVTFAKDQVEKAKQAREGVPETVLTPCEALLSELKRFTWGSRPSDEPRRDVREKKGAPQRTSGVLESISSWGVKTLATYRRTIHIKTSRTTVAIDEETLDKASKEKLARIEGAILDIANAVERLDAIARQKEKPLKEPTAGASVRARPVEVRGIKLTPSFTFTDSAITKIHLETGFAGDGGVGFDEHGMQRTLVEALEEKFGPADERNSLASERQYVWKFPKTVIRCTAGRRDFPGSVFVRKWVGITYEKPPVDNTPSADKL